MPRIDKISPPRRFSDTFVQTAPLTETFSPSIYDDALVLESLPQSAITESRRTELTVPEIKVGDPAEMWSAVDETTAAADAKRWNKRAARSDCAQINVDGKLTLICKNKKPTSEFKIRLKGVSGS